MIGGWTDRGPLERGLVAISFSDEHVAEARGFMASGVKADPKRAARELIGQARSYLRGRSRDSLLDWVGILLVDGLALAEIVVREFSVARDLPIPIVGGAAADELAFKETTVACDGAESSDGAVLLLLRMKVPFHYGHYVHYRPTEKEFTITKADPSRRIVWEIEGRPAAEYYAGLLGLGSAEKIEHIHFARNPLGVVIEDAVYVRSPNLVVDGTGLQFYCFIEAGTRMKLLTQGDVIKNAKEALRSAEDRIGPLGGALLFNCVLRYLEMKDGGLLDEFGKVFGGFPMAGFNTYGEELFTHHNQTLTALFLGRPE